MTPESQNNGARRKWKTDADGMNATESEANQEKIEVIQKPYEGHHA
jgi:hypothetical protein